MFDELLKLFLSIGLIVLAHQNRDLMMRLRIAETRIDELCSRSSRFDSNIPEDEASTEKERRGGNRVIWCRVTLILQKQELEIALKTIKNT